MFYSYKRHSCSSTESNCRSVFGNLDAPPSNLQVQGYHHPWCSSFQKKQNKTHPDPDRQSSLADDSQREGDGIRLT